MMTKEMMILTASIADRAVKLYADQGVKVKRLDVLMDLEYCHENAQELDFEKLHGFDDGNFAHDVGGIRRHFNRETFELDDCFSPRCSVPAGGRS